MRTSYTIGKMLLIALFSERKRLIQDILLGTAVVRSDIG